MKIRRKDAAVRRIAARSMHTNRTRNLFAALAILLTTFMISTVFSIGLSFAENYQATQVRLNGTTASIFLNNPSASQTQQIAASDQLEAVGTQISVGSTTQKPGMESLRTSLFYPTIKRNGSGISRLLLERSMATIRTHRMKSCSPPGRLSNWGSNCPERAWLFPSLICFMAKPALTPFV